MSPTRQPTVESATVLADFLRLTEDGRNWIFQQYFSALSAEDFVELEVLMQNSKAMHSGGHKPDFHELAHKRLMDDPTLSAGEKVLLAALILFELYEVSDFHSRQITETLKQNSIPLGNITSALAGLINRGEVEFSDSIRSVPNAHKRYRLTKQGMDAAKKTALMPHLKPNLRE